MVQDMYEDSKAVNIIDNYHYHFITKNNSLSLCRDDLAWLEGKATEEIQLVYR